jgi:hypothetical protein
MICKNQLGMRAEDHGTLRMPPALKAHVTDHVWTFEELVAMIDAHDPKRPMEFKSIPMDQI